MSRQTISLTRLYGFIPLIISGILTVCSLALLLFIAVPAGGIPLRDLHLKDGIITDCNTIATSILWSLRVIFYYLSIPIIALAFVTSVASYFYDRRLFIFYASISLIFSGPFFAMLDDSVIVLSTISLKRTCASTFSSGMLSIHYVILFFSCYFIFGNTVMLLRRKIKDVKD